MVGGAEVGLLATDRPEQPHSCCLLSPGDGGVGVRGRGRPQTPSPAAQGRTLSHGLELEAGRFHKDRTVPSEVS